MAVSIDDLTTPLVPANVRGDLIYLAVLVGVTISVRPSDPSYQLVDWLAKWFTFYWNTYAIPGLRGQFGGRAAGAWLTLWAGARGVARPLDTFATGSVTIENRSLVFVDTSAVGAVSIALPGGQTIVSQGPAPGSTGTMGAAIGSTYLQTTLIFQATQAGTQANTAPGAIPGYPAALAEGPTGVYVATAGSSPPAPSGGVYGSAQYSDPALLALTYAAQASSASPGAPKQKYLATILGAQLPGGVAVATSRARIVGVSSTVTCYCATPTGPTPGSVSSIGTELYCINAAVQITCAQPGMVVSCVAAVPFTITFSANLLIAAESGISQAQAVATAQAAFQLWQSLLPVGGGNTGGASGYVYLTALEAALQSSVNPTYPAAWEPGAYYAVGAQASYNAQTFSALTPGTSSTLTGPSGMGTSAGIADGSSGLTWAPTALTGGAAQFTAAPGVYDVVVTGMTGDVVYPGVGYVAQFAPTITASIYAQT